MIDEKYFNERNLLILAVVISILYFVFLILVSHLEFQQYDAYYYLSVSHALLQEGKLLDYTTIPPRELLSPQNGIVFLYAFLGQIGLSEDVTKLRVVAFINGVLIVLSTIYLFRIIKLLEINYTVAFLLALSFPLSFFYQFTLLLQKNDCIFIALSLITIYKLLQQDKLTDSLGSLILLAVALSLFRIVGILIFISALITFLIQKQYKKAIVSLGLIIISISASYMMLYLFEIDTSRMELHSRESTSLYSWNFIYLQVENTLTLSIPESIFRFTYYTTNIALSSTLFGLIISLIFIFLLILNIRETITERALNKTGMIFLILYILATLAFFQLYKAQPTRYLLTISPLLPILLFTLYKGKKSQIMAASFVIVTTIISLFGMLNTDKFDIAREKYTYWQNYATVSEFEHMKLIAYLPRISYFLLNKRSIRDIQEKIIIPEEGLIIVGPELYIRYIADKIEGLNSGKYILYTLPVAYTDFVGNKMGPHYFPYQKVSVKTLVIEPNDNSE